MNFQSRLHDSEILLDLFARNLDELVVLTVDRLTTLGKLVGADRQAVDEAIAERGVGMPVDLGSSVGVLRIQYDGEGDDYHCALVRVPSGVRASDHERIHFLWVVLAPFGASMPLNEDFEPFGWMLHDERFSASILGADDPMQVLAAYQLYLEYVEAPPKARRPSLVPTYATVTEVEGTGLGAGLKADIERRAPSYKDDFVAGFTSKGLATILFIFFACLAPSVAFGGLLAYLTDGQIGVVEAIVATAVGGVLYATFSGQPLTLLGSTGPVTIFLGILYQLCASLEVPFFAGLFWVGMWTSLILIVCAFTNASRYILYFTRFTDEIFGALIALIFTVAALRDMFGGLMGPEPPTEGKLLGLLLALGTFVIALQLSRVRQKPLLLPKVREFLADFGPAIAIFVMTAIAFEMHLVQLEHLAVPEHFATTTGRPWLVNPADAPVWFWFASIPIALLGGVLMYLDQNITVRLVNSPQHRLTKGEGYNLDLLVVGVLTGICAMFGLPWVVAATVRSLNHVRALATVSHHARGEHIISVQENRLTALVVHLLIGGSLLFLDALREVPMSVLWGLFLYMGIASTRGNQFVDRLKLFITDPSSYPPTHYVRRVPRSVIHTYTAIQMICLAVLWIVKVSAYGVLFPLFIAALVPIRGSLNRIFDERHLAFLDADESPDEEMYRDID